MEEEEGGGIRLSKRLSDKGGEVDYKDKAGTAWSHSYLNQKPWHPLSYPNQRRKWIAEQTHAQRDRRAQEVAREFAQEQEFFRQTALISKKEKEKDPQEDLTFKRGILVMETVEKVRNMVLLFKFSGSFTMPSISRLDAAHNQIDNEEDQVEMMKAVSFMYVRPPGFNAESAKAAEIADERRRLEQDSPSHDGPSTAMLAKSVAGRNHPGEERKKPRPKDVFGRPLPTEEEFEVLKNAPRLETGVPARVKPFGVEVRNVKCVRCGNYGHQSGDRECPLKDVIMPNEESRLKRDDPLTAILAHTDTSEPLKWELKQKPGISPPRGGFKPDDPNQQIVSEDIFDEYGGFLSGENIIPELLTNFSSSKPKKRKSSKKGKHKRPSSPTSSQPKDPQQDEAERRSRKDNKHRKKKRNHSESSSSDDDSEDYGGRRSKKDNKYRKKKQNDSESSLSDNSEDDRERRSKKDNIYKNKKRIQNRSEPCSSDNSDDNEKRRPKKDDKYRKRRNHSESSSDNPGDDGKRSNKVYNYRKKRNSDYSSSSDNSQFDRHHKKSRNKHSDRNSSQNIDPDRHYRSKHHHRHHHSHHH
ncbi:putative zinc finger CCHC domain-containing protein [Vitis vinifera]|uniref:Putative zinc finger CCHC domain-containing protein n=1 Tax=Vitis vinifera TaxID=29760 RepID=A0A438IZN4_VITVI|nr:putative zinc finger CCHC domain-containing protein [Vitis vinifera]